MHTKLVSKQFSATHLPETTVGLWKVCIIWIMHTLVCIIWIMHTKVCI